MMKQRALLKDTAQDRKQRMFVYILAFVVMTATLGMFVWGHDAQERDAYEPYAPSYQVYDYDAAEEPTYADNEEQDIYECE